MGTTKVMQAPAGIVSGDGMLECSTHHQEEDGMKDIFPFFAGGGGGWRLDIEKEH